MSTVPPAVTKDQLLELLERALASALGVRVETNDPNGLSARLTPLRDGDSKFSILRFHLSPFSIRELWLVKHAKEEGRVGSPDGPHPPKTLGPGEVEEILSTIGLQRGDQGTGEQAGPASRDRDGEGDGKL